MRRWLRPAVGLAATALFVWLAFGTIHWGEVRRVVAGGRAAPLLLALALLAADFATRIARWWWMLRAVAPSLPLRACARPFLVSLALNNTLPLRAGDVVRAFAFRDALRAPTARVVGTLVVERLLDLSVLVALFFVGLLATPAGAVPRALVVGGAAFGAAALGGVLALVVAPAWLTRVVARTLGRPALARRAWTARLGEAARDLFDTLAVVCAPRRAAQLLAFSAVAWLLEGGVFACVAASLGTFDGAARAVAPVVAPWFACAAGTLATLIPSSPGYVGTFDFFVIRALAAHGAAPAAAAAFAVIVHLVLWAPVTVAGLALFVATGSRRPHPFRPSAAAEPA